MGDHRVVVSLLGPVAASAGSRPVHLTGRLGRSTLAVLALAAGRAVPTEALVDALWGDSPPATAREQVHNQVSRLRRAGLGTAVVTVAGGYRLDGAEVDVAIVAALAADAGRHDDPAVVAALLRQALGRWRGEPLGGVGAHLAAVERPALVVLRQGLVEDLMTALLELGDTTGLLAELAERLREYPCSEILHRIRMVALTRAGRPGEALRAYADARRLLGTELGVEPSPELRDLAARLRTEQTPARVASRPTRPRPPAQLPPAPRRFAGRAAELAELGRLLRPDPPSRLRLVLVNGMPGVGKTALALRAAAAAAGDFPDGILYAGLGGGGPGPAADPAAVLGSFLRALGLEGAAQPTGLDDRSAELRTRTAGCRLLLLLDDAVDEEQVEPLLPADPGCATVITSRSALAGIDADRVMLRPVPDIEARAIVTAYAGRRPLAPEPLDRIVVACGGVPLALRLAGAELAVAPELEPADLAGRLEGGRVLGLTAGRLSLRNSLDSSLNRVDPPARMALSRLARFGPVAEPWVVAALLALPLRGGHRLLAELARRSLLEPVASATYRFHDLVRAHVLGTTGTDPGWTEAFQRAVERAVALTEHVHAATFPDRPLAIRLPTTGATASALPAALRSAIDAGPVGWIATHWPVLRQVLAAALDAGDLAPASALVMSSAAPLLRAELLDECEWAAAALARSGSGDTTARSTAALVGSWVCAQRGQHPRSAELAGQVVAAGGTIAARLRIEGLTALASSRLMCDEPEPALAALAEATELARRLGDRRSEFSAALTLAEVHRRQSGDLTAALEHATRAEALADAGADVRYRAMARYCAAQVHLALGRPEPAARRAGDALRTCRDIEDRVGEAWCLQLAARVAVAAGDPATAVRLAGRSTELARQLDRPDAEAAGEVALAQALDALGDGPGAVDAAGRARRLHDRFDSPTERLAVERLARELGGSVR